MNLINKITLRADTIADGQQTEPRQSLSLSHAVLPTSELTVVYEGVGGNRWEEGKRSWMMQSEEGESGLVCRVVNQEDCGEKKH